MEKYYEFSEKAEAWDEEDMTDEETLYYLKVMNRVNEKLLEIEEAMGWNTFAMRLRTKTFDDSFSP